MTAEPHATDPVAEPRLETPALVDDHQPTSAQRLAGWLVWHALEIGSTSLLTGVTLATGWWPLWILVALVVAGWGGHELHQRRVH